MAQQTQLHVNALPGQVQSFSAKTAASVQITKLSIMALPGPVQTFSAKTAAVSAITPHILGGGLGGDEFVIGD